MFCLRLIYAAACLCLCIAWLIPNHFLPWNDFYQEFFAFLALLFLLIASSWESKKISISCVFWCVSILVVLAQFLFGMFYYLSDFLMVLAYLFASLMAYQIGLSTRIKKEVVNGLALVFTFGAVVSALIGIAQFCGYTSFWLVDVGLGRSSGNLAQANNYGSLLVLGWVMLTYLYVDKQVSKLFYVALLLVLSLGGLTSESRTTLLQVLLVLVILMWFVKKRIVPRDMLLFAPIIFFVMLYFSFPYLKGLIHLSDVADSRLVDGPYANRLDLWALSGRAVISGGWLGNGWGQLVIANFSVLDPLEGRQLYVKYSHNIIIDLLVWNGPIVGGILLGFLLVWFVKRFLDVGSKESLCLFLAVCVLIVHALLEYPLAYAYFLLPFSLMLGLLDNGCIRAVYIRVNSYVYTSVLFFLFVFSFYFLTKEYLIIEADHRLMRAQNFGLQVDMQSRLSKDVILLDQEREFIRFARMPAQAGLGSDELERMRKVVYRKPHRVVIYRYSLALKLNGYDDKAANELKKIEAYYGEKNYLRYKRLFDQEFLARREKESG